ncbi:MAG TPA: LysR family transcriptional regulator [Caldimonas sp.]|jgi:DNA-binding transcriptional LysR family regulator|nr:LysR family transcriptional regulator [Caldimonas sp.]HEX2539697.1 LysR family transcriptional regulator [Caldimonas sp.]
MDLNLRNARAFVVVARHGSFTKAAALLHLSQPALTVQIRNFESALKVKVLDRSSRSVELTQTGRELLPTLERMLHEFDTIVADTHATSAGRRGTVRIAALPSFASGLLPDVIRAVRETEPGLGFVVRDAVASRVIDLVVEEEVDLGLTGGEMPTDQVEVLHRCEDRLCVVFPRDHAFARLRTVKFEDLVGVPMVLTDHATSLRAVVESAFSRARLRPVVVCETTHMLTAAAMVASGLGVAILPGSAREREAMPGLASRSIDDEAFVRPLALVKKARRTLSAACDSFAQACIAGLERSASAPAAKPARKSKH